MRNVPAIVYAENTFFRIANSGNYFAHRTVYTIYFIFPFPLAEKTLWQIEFLDAFFNFIVAVY